MWGLILRADAWARRYRDRDITNVTGYAVRCRCCFGKFINYVNTENAERAKDSEKRERGRTEREKKRERGGRGRQTDRQSVYLSK